MKVKLLLISLISMVVLSYITAQEMNVVAENLETPVQESAQNYSKEAFSELINKDIEKAEHRFWIDLAEKRQSAIDMAWQLGLHYKAERNYEKANLFLKELLPLLPEDIDVLCINAEIAVMRERERQALELYEKVLAKDPDHLGANIFVGNYHYFQAQREKQRLESDYNKLKSPTRMQYADYRNDLDELLSSNYAKAKKHLERVESQFSSIEIKRALDNIRSIEKEVKK